MNPSESRKVKKWLNPMFEFDEDEPPKKVKKSFHSQSQPSQECPIESAENHGKLEKNVNHRYWVKSFDPKSIEQLAVHNKKIAEVEEWLNTTCNVNNNRNDILLLSGPVGCGKTTTLLRLCEKYNIKLTEWITPLDIEMPSENGISEYKERQSSIFLDFLIKAANFTSLLDNNSNKLVLVEDFPNTFNRTPSELNEVLQQFKNRAKSPLVFICSETHADNKNSALNLFTPALKEQFQINHVMFNGVSTTGLRGALKRVAEIMNKHPDIYNLPSSDMIECVVNSSAGDIRSAVLNLHFATLRGSKQSLNTSVLIDKEHGKKSTKKKKTSRKFLSIGKNETISILHGVGRVLNPKVLDNGKLSHSPSDITDQFLSQPSSFVNFLEENYLPHFSCIDHANQAASALSDADFMLSEWREKMCQEYGLFIAVAGLMIANKAPLSAWNPVRGPKNMRIQYPNQYDVPLLDKDLLYKGKVLVSDYQTYCKIITSKS